MCSSYQGKFASHQCQHKVLTFSLQNDLSLFIAHLSNSSATSVSPPFFLWTHVVLAYGAVEWPSNEWLGHLSWGTGPSSLWSSSTNPQQPCLGPPPPPKKGFNLQPFKILKQHHPSLQNLLQLLTSLKYQILTFRHLQTGKSSYTSLSQATTEFRNSGPRHSPAASSLAPFSNHQSPSLQRSNLFPWSGPHHKQLYQRCPQLKQSFLRRSPSSSAICSLELA